MGTRGPYPGVCYGDANQTPKAIAKDGDCAVKPRKEYDEAYDNMWTKVGDIKTERQNYRWEKIDMDR